MPDEKKEATLAMLSAFVRNVVAAGTALLAIMAAIWWLAAPRIVQETRAFLAEEVGLDVSVISKLQQTLTAQQETISNISATQVQLAGTVRALSEQMSEVQESRRTSVEPPVRWASRGHRVSDGAPGEFVTISMMIYKVRDCGRPRSVAYIVDGVGTVHAVTDKSTTGSDGLSVPLRVGTEVLRHNFSARIPPDDGVEPGSGYFYLVVDWPEVCPQVPPATSPEVPFRILPPT